MCAPVNEEWRQVVTECRGRVVDGKLGEREVDVLVVLAAIGVARNVSLMTPLARSTLALVFLWFAEPTMRHEPMLLAKA